MNQYPSCDNCSQNNTCGWKAQQSGKWCTGYTPLYQPTKTTAGTEMTQNERTCRNCGDVQCRFIKTERYLPCSEWEPRPIPPAKPKPEPVKEPEACVWRKNGNYKGAEGWWYPEHANGLYVIDDVLKAFNFCPYCGKKIEVTK